MTETPPLPAHDALADLIDEYGLWEIHQALAAHWQAHDMVLDPPHVEHQASRTPWPSLTRTEFAKETTFGTPIMPTTFLPIGNPNTTTSSFTLNIDPYGLPVVPPEWAAEPFIPQTPIQAVPVDEAIASNLPQIIASVLEDEDDDE